MTDPFFADLRRALAGLPEGRTEEILAELESHVDERAETLGREAALAVMGDPRDIAALYKASEITSQPTRPSPWRLLRAIELLAGVSIGGAFTLAGALVGYTAGLFLLAMAALKPFIPDRIGLWVWEAGDTHFSIGRTDAPTGEEVLGWTVIPIGLILGLSVIYLTWRWSLAAARGLLRARLKRN